MGLWGRFIGFLSEGNRPIRILLFGGIFLAWLMMTLLAKLFDIDTDISGDVGMASVILIIVSMLAGFGVALYVFSYLDNVRREREGDDPQ